MRETNIYEDKMLQRRELSAPEEDVGHIYMEHNILGVQTG